MKVSTSFYQSIHLSWTVYNVAKVITEKDHNILDTIFYFWCEKKKEIYFQTNKNLITRVYEFVNPPPPPPTNDKLCSKNLRWYNICICGNRNETNDCL